VPLVAAGARYSGMNSDALLRRAIVRRRFITAWYGGGHRLLMPLCYGRGGSGVDLLRAYQFAGASSEGESEGWKMLRVPRMRAVTLTGPSFSSVPEDYNPDDPLIAAIRARVDPAGLGRFPAASRHQLRGRQ
jgi:hypothetical protein